MTNWISIVALIIGGGVTATALAQEGIRTYECPQHKHLLVVQEVGYEHVSHQVTVNKQLVTQVSSMWFVEKANCTKMGFQITISHAQYGDPTEQIFDLVIKVDGSHTLSEI